MDNTQELTLDIRDNQTYQQLYTKQYDYGSSIIFHIVNDGSPFDIEGVTAIFSLKKPDGRFIENNADVINGNIQIKITEQMTSVYGKAKFSITLLKDEVAITTITGIMKIDEAVIHPEDIESSDEYNVITDILHKVSDDYEAIKISESNAKESEEIAKASEINAQISETNTLNYATKAESYAIGETNSRPEENTDNAKYYCQQSNIAASEALTKASEASTYATNAESFATTAATKATQADNSATSAGTSATTAVTKALEAADSAQEAKSYAIGTNNIFRENDETDNSKYYYEQLKGISEGLNGALLPMGTIAFSDLKTQNKQSGFMYNISDSFVTDETFREGAGYTYPEGTNVYYTADGYWDCLAGIPVTGVKGKNETSYRKGNINITPEDVGALSANGDTKDNTVAFLSEDSESVSAWSDVAVMSSGEKHSSLFNKISTMFKNIRYLNKILGTTDISSIGGGTVTGAINAVNNNLSHIGMVIHTTTLDTVEKVIAVYGGTKWEKIEGRFLLGQSSSYTIKSTGGSANAIVPYHRHSFTPSGTVSNHRHSFTPSGTVSNHRHSFTPSGTVSSHTHSYGYTGIQIPIGSGTWFSVLGNYARENVSTAQSTFTGTASNTGYAQPTFTGTASNTDYAQPTFTGTANNTGYAGTTNNTNGANMPPYKTVYIWERTA